MKLSILTATYNRGILLKRIYNSILENMCKEIEPEWIVVDDGSNDNTKEIIDELKSLKETKFEIKYMWQENAGKMSAINKATEMSTGDIIVDCDSDDFFAENSFKIIADNCGFLFANPDLYAMCFLKGSLINEKELQISGNKFKENYLISTMFDLYFKDDVEGEKILVFNSQIRKMFKHELVENEKFVTEARMYHKMDEKYKVLCINEIIEIGDYLEDGYTRNITKVLKLNPKGYHEYFREILKKGLKGLKLRKKLYVIKNFLIS